MMRKDITMSTKQQAMSPSHQQKMAKHNKNLIYRYYREVWNDMPPTGHQSMRQFVAAFRSALPDLNLTIDDMVGQWNKVAIRFTIQGTHKHELLGAAPTGQPVTLSGMMIHHIANEKITDTWFSHDFVSTIKHQPIY